MAKDTKKKSKPKKEPTWLAATRDRLRTKGVAPAPPPIAPLSRLDERVEGLTALFNEARRMLPGQVDVAQDLTDLAWNGPEKSREPPIDPATFSPAVTACYGRLLELRATQFGDDRRAAFMIRVVERDGGWEIRARMMDLG